MPGGCILGREQHRAAPLAAETDTLAEPAYREQHGGDHPDRGVGRQEADQHRRYPHGQQRGNEGGFAAHAIAEVAEQRRADRTREEGECKGRERLQTCRG